MFDLRNSRKEWEIAVPGIAKRIITAADNPAGQVFGDRFVEQGITVMAV